MRPHTHRLLYIHILHVNDQYSLNPMIAGFSCISLKIRPFQGQKTRNLKHFHALLNPKQNALTAFYLYTWEWF